MARGQKLYSWHKSRRSPKQTVAASKYEDNIQTKEKHADNGNDYICYDIKICLKMFVDEKMFCNWV